MWHMTVFMEAELHVTEQLLRYTLKLFLTTCSPLFVFSTKSDYMHFSSAYVFTTVLKDHNCLLLQLKKMTATVLTGLDTIIIFNVTIFLSLALLMLALTTEKYWALCNTLSISTYFFPSNNTVNCHLPAHLLICPPGYRPTYMQTRKYIRL